MVGTGTAEQTFLADRNGNFVLGWTSDGAGGFTVGTAVGSLQPIRIDSGAAGSDAAATCPQNPRPVRISISMSMCSTI